MAAPYAAYATKVSDALQSLLDTTGVKVEPAVEFVSCGVGLHEHFVPKMSLEKHLRKCHGERRPRPINNAAFYYGRLNTVTPQDTGTGGQVEAGMEDNQGEDGGLQSLVEPEAEGQETGTEQEGVIAAIQKVATSVGAFYEQVQAWRRIPRAFATMKDNERGLITPSSLRRWLNAELSRPGVLPSNELLDEELVEYVVGLLDHPDFCQPDLLVLELQEFLGSSVTNIVLALWKFMIVEIGLLSVFVRCWFLSDWFSSVPNFATHWPKQKTETSGAGNKIQVISSITSCEPVALNNAPTKAEPHSTDAITERDYKRRRASYRGKVGTKTGPAAFREMIQKHMVGLSLEMDRELVLGGGFHEEDGSGEYPSKTQPAYREGVNWRNCTDALEVRNRNRPRRQDQASSKTQRSKPRSRSRGRSTVDNAHRRHKSDVSPGRSRRRSPERRRKSRSRSQGRSLRHRDHHDSDRRHRSRKTSEERDRSAHRHRRHGDYRC